MKKTIFLSLSFFLNLYLTYPGSQDIKQSLEQSERLSRSCLIISDAVCNVIETSFSLCSTPSHDQVFAMHNTEGVSTGMCLYFIT